MPAPNNMENNALWLPSINHSIKYHVLKFLVPHSFKTDGSKCTGSGKAKPGIFINKIPRIAIPLKESSKIIRSD